MEFGRSDDLRKLLHVHWLDVDNVWLTPVSFPQTQWTDSTRGLTEALIADVQVPQVDSQVICRDVCLTIRVHGYRVDVISVSIGIDLSRDGRGDRVVGSHLGQT